MTTTFKRIALRNWRQFAHVSIDVHPRLTIITGSNGAGKSTILNVFSQHFGFSRPFLATPKRGKGGQITYDLGYYSSSSQIFDDEVDDSEEDEWSELFRPTHDPEEAPPAPPPPGSFVTIGDIEYGNGTRSEIGYHDHQANIFGLSLQNQQHVPGVYVSSHRTNAAYQPIQGLSLNAMALSQAYATYFNELNARNSGGHTPYSPVYRMKEALIAMAAFGEGNSHLESNKELLEAFNGFVAILRKVLPKELGFQSLSVRLPDIVIKTRAGEFIIDSSSGGLNAVIEIAWQVYLYSLTNDEFVATIDEPENHLHPSMQRSILANIVSAFPKVQFIVATHSPFIVSAVEDSFVYALKYTGAQGPNGFPRNGLRRVRSVRLDQTSKAGTASEILREVLGVSVTIPDWAQQKLDRIVDKYEHAEVTPITLKDLRGDLIKAGFSEFYPEALARLVENK